MSGMVLFNGRFVAHPTVARSYPVAINLPLKSICICGWHCHTGLTIGLLSLDPLNLEVLAKSGYGLFVPHHRDSYVAY